MDGEDNVVADGSATSDRENKTPSSGNEYESEEEQPEEAVGVITPEKENEGAEALDHHNDPSPLSDADPVQEISQSWIKLEKGSFFDTEGPRGGLETQEIEQVDNSSEEGASHRYEKSDEGVQEARGLEDEDDVFSKYASVSLEERAEIAM